MPIPSSVPWGSRLRDVLGAPFNEITSDHLGALVTTSVCEAADLDFKGPLYGNSDADKRELCKDIAAMRNDRGGVIILGVEDCDGVASAAPGVPLSDAEEVRMRSIVASGTAPHAAFDIQRVAGGEQGTGYYLLIAPPSPLRPHAVLLDNGFRYPRRDGAGTRYMSEVEIADLYRSRFNAEADQADRLGTVLDDTWASIEQDGPPWLIVALVPNDAGALSMSFDERSAVEQWINGQRSGADPIAAFNQIPATVSVTGKRYTARSVMEQRNTPARWEYAESHSDGAASYATYVTYGATTEGGPRVVSAEALVWSCLQALRFVGRAAARAGVYGDVILAAAMMPGAMQLGFVRWQSVEPYNQSQTIGLAASRHTVPLDALTEVSPDMMRVARLLLNDLANDFGLAELPQLATDGSIRNQHLGGDDVDRLVRAWGLSTTDEQVSM